MNDAPFIAVGVAKEAGCCKEKQAPAVFPELRVRAVDLLENRADLVAVGVKIPEPVERSLFVVLAVPPPVVFDFEQIRKALTATGVGRLLQMFQAPGVGRSIKTPTSGLRPQRDIKPGCDNQR